MENNFLLTIMGKNLTVRLKYRQCPTQSVELQSKSSDQCESNHLLRTRMTYTVQAINLCYFHTDKKLNRKYFKLRGSIK